MANAFFTNRFEVGVVGLDPCGRKLARTMAARGMSVVACDSNSQNITAWQTESPGISIRIAPTLAELTRVLRQFRTVVLSGSDAAHHSFNELLGQLDAGDLIIDAGHCHFKTCGRRALWLDERNIRHLAVGIIGGGDDGRCGPVFMVGGRQETCRSAFPLLQSMAPEAGGERCVSHLGPAAAGPFVKMIHDAIEYSLMQQVAEASDVLKLALAGEGNQLCFAGGLWPTGSVQGRPAVECVRWASETAGELEACCPTIAAAAGTRAISDVEKKNDIALALFRQPLGQFGNDPESILDELDCALRAALLITYAQGLAILLAGSERYQFNIDVAEVIRLWKKCGGIHEPMLEEIASAIRATPNLPNLLYDDDLSEQVMERQECLRHAVWRATCLQTRTPALKASLDYLDSYRGAWLPGNLVQAHAQSAAP
jgi:6-phosphogluconate dehydrogenase